MTEVRSLQSTSSPPYKPGQNAALIILDVINDFAFPGADLVRPRALAAAAAIDGLRHQFKERKLPVIYVNDNFGEWRVDCGGLLERAAIADNSVTQALKPEADDYFVLKPQFSGFYATTLPVLLPTLGVSRLVLTGLAADICVLFTAADAHMRAYSLWVPADVVAGEQADREKWALEIMANSMTAETAPTSDLTLIEWMSKFPDQG